MALLYHLPRITVGKFQPCFLLCIIRGHREDWCAGCRRGLGQATLHARTPECYQLLPPTTTIDNAFGREAGLTLLDAIIVQSAAGTKSKSTERRRYVILADERGLKRSEKNWCCMCGWLRGQPRLAVTGSLHLAVITSSFKIDFRDALFEFRSINRRYAVLCNHPTFFYRGTDWNEKFYL